MNRTKTFLPKEKDFQRKTYLMDASGKTLGRLAAKVASLLIGKGKVVVAPDQWSGDAVVIINAKEIFVTGKKKEQKIYTHYTGYPGGLRSYSYEELLEKKPEEIILRAVSRMLPKNRLGEKMLKNLHVYAGNTHRQQAQKPVTID